MILIKLSSVSVATFQVNGVEVTSQSEQRGMTLYCGKMFGPGNAPKILRFEYLNQIISDFDIFSCDAKMTP